MRIVAPCAAAAACGAPVYLPKEPPPLELRADDSGDTGGDTGGHTGVYQTPPCSTYGVNPVTLELTNARETTLDLFWRDLGCAEVLYATVPPGGGFSQPSFEDHVWVVRELATGQLVEALVLGPDPVQAWEVR